MDSIYYSLLEAREELRRRHHLRSTVEGWWQTNGWNPPKGILRSGLIAGLGYDAVATRRFYDIVFFEQAKRAGFTPVWLTYERSMFSSESPFKRQLLHPVFFEKRGRHLPRGIVTRRYKLASIEANKGKRLHEIVLDDGMPLIMYHRRLHRAFGQRNAIVDLSDFYETFEYDVRRYYWAYLSFFIAHAVLFDDYHGGEDARVSIPLTREIFKPTFDGLKSRFGVAPIIVKMPWHRNLSYFLRPEEKDWAKHEIIPEHFLPPDKNAPAQEYSMNYAIASL